MNSSRKSSNGPLPLSPANDDNALEKSVSLDFGKSGKYEVYYLDDEHDPKKAEITSSLEFVLPRNGSILVKEI